MTNTEWMATLTAEQCYGVMEWLFFDYGRRWNGTRLAIIAWCDMKREDCVNTYHDPFATRESFVVYESDNKEREENDHD